MGCVGEVNFVELILVRGAVTDRVPWGLRGRGEGRGSKVGELGKREVSHGHVLQSCHRRIGGSVV